jgi:hypothetical protein
VELVNSYWYKSVHIAKQETDEPTMPTKVEIKFKKKSVTIGQPTHINYLMSAEAIWNVHRNQHLNKILRHRQRAAR